MRHGAKEEVVKRARIRVLLAKMRRDASWYYLCSEDLKTRFFWGRGRLVLSSLEKLHDLWNSFEFSDLYGRVRQEMVK
jgi:hypothetical protein